MAQSNDTIPYGYCQCGCGERTPICEFTIRKRGHVAGQPHRYAHGHHGPARPLYEVDPESGCWHWRRTRMPSGYGVIERGGQKMLAHRFVFERHRGPISEGLQLHHTCENPRCVNPDHLEPLTSRQHNRVGGHMKLTYEQVSEIRRLAPTMTQVAIAGMFGVARETVGRIVRGELRVHD